MKKVLLLLILLVGCAPVEPPALSDSVPQAGVDVLPVVPEQQIQTFSDPVVKTVKQTGSLGTFVYGLSGDNRLLRVEKTGALWEYFYDDGRLVEISGPQNFEFFYEFGRLSGIDSGARRLSFVYDERGRLVEVKGFQETLYMDYDSSNQLSSVKRNVVKTGFDYSDGRVKRITKGPLTTNVFYDDKNRVRSFDSGDSKFILGYWRDNKIISLSGKSFGIGLTVSYGPDYPPFEAKLISSEDDSTFTSTDTDTLYKVVDDYVYCKYVRRLKDISFEPVSFVFLMNYFEMGLPGYLAMQFACVPYES